MKKKQQHVYPPFPSFAWVMTTQANPPAPAYAHGYVQSAHAHNGPYPRPRHPALRAAPRAHHKAHRHSKRPPSPTTRIKAGAHDEKLMKTVDYRYHDPPFRPYVPWHEGYTLRGRGAQQPHRHQHHQHHQAQHALPSDFTISSRARTPPANATAVSKCELIGGPDGENDVVRRKKKTTTIDGVVNIKRLDIMLSALGRVCRLSNSKIASKGSGGSSMLT